MAPSKTIENVSGPPIKRQKTSVPSDDLFSNELFDVSSTTTLTAQYASSTPYKHSVIPALFQDGFLRHVRQEIMDNLVFTEKETDIYKVRQTGDLANLDGLDAEEANKLSNLRLLRNALYSNHFREFVRSITGVGALSGSKIDMSINNYSQGCHLLNHDDVIGTRSVSYILYLPDPIEPWKAEYGGSLELYPVKVKGIPEDIPTVILPPSWNQFIMFAVQPGHSFHSVEEVVAQGKDRLSISGWFHVAQEGEEGYAKVVDDESQQAKSTLEQLLLEQEESFQEYKTTMNEAEQLSDDDRTVLKKFIDERYLDLRTLVQINEKFCDESQIALSGVMRSDFADRLKIAFEEKDKAEGIGSHLMNAHNTGVGAGWTIQGPPHRQRYMIPSIDEEQDESSQLMKELEHGLSSNAFRKWLSLITSSAPVSRLISARRFRPGLDYTLATSNRQTMVEVNLCLTPASPIWESGEVGGYCCYMAPHEDEDAAVYKSSSEDDGVLMTSNASWNEMTIVLRDPGILSFTKYVAVRAGASRWDVSGQFVIADESDQEDE